MRANASASPAAAALTSGTPSSIVTLTRCSGSPKCCRAGSGADRRPPGPPCRVASGAGDLCAMHFDVAAQAYDRFMGRFSAPLAPQLADLARVRSGQRVLDVGCGPGALTAELVARVGAARVAA